MNSVHIFTLHSVSILILSSHICLSLSNGIFPPTTTLQFSSLLSVLQSRPLFLLHLIIPILYRDEHPLRSFSLCIFRTPISATQLKVKLSLPLCLTYHRAMKTYWRSRGIAPHILDLGTSWIWVVSFTPRQLYIQEKDPQYPLNMRVVGHQSWSGHGVEEKNFQP
jgi:hypothetical protein